MAGLGDAFDRWGGVDPARDSLAGGSIRRRRQPEMGAMPPSSTGERFASWLASLGMPRRTANQIGAVVPFTPPGGAFDAGQIIGEGIESGSPSTMGIGAGLAAFGAIPAARLPASLRATARHRFSSLNDAQLDDLSRWVTGSYHDLHRGIHGLPEDVAQSALRVWPHNFGLRLDNATLRPGRYASDSRSLVREQEGTPLLGTSVWGIHDIKDPRSVFDALQRARHWQTNTDPYNRLTLLGELGSGTPRAGTDPGELLFRRGMALQQWRIGRR